MSNIQKMNDRELMEAIYTELNELKNCSNLVNSKFEQLNIELNTKIDILCNFKPAQQKSSNDTDSKKKPPSKPIFIKEKIKTNKDEFIDLLYTHEEYSKCVEMIEQKNIKSKKTDDEKLKQLVDLIYKEVINTNSEYKTKATQLHNEFKKTFLENIENDSNASAELLNDT